MIWREQMEMKNTSGSPSTRKKNNQTWLIHPPFHFPLLIWNKQNIFSNPLDWCHWCICKRACTESWENRGKACKQNESVTRWHTSVFSAQPGGNKADRVIEAAKEMIENFDSTGNMDFAAEIWATQLCQLCRRDRGICQLIVWNAGREKLRQLLLKKKKKLKTDIFADIILATVVKAAFHYDSLHSCEAISMSMTLHVPLLCRYGDEGDGGTGGVNCLFIIYG